MGGGGAGYQPVLGLVRTPVHLINISRHDERAPGLQPLRLVQRVARVPGPQFRLVLLATGDGPASSDPREGVVTGSRSACSSGWSWKQARAKVEGGCPGTEQFRAWEGRDPRLESWLTRQVSVWMPIGTVQAPVPHCRAKAAMVAILGLCSGTSRS